MVAVNAKQIIDSMPDAMKLELTYSGKKVKGVRAALAAEHISGLYGEAQQYQYSFYYPTAQLKGVTADSGKRCTLDGTTFLILGTVLDGMNAITRLDLGDQFA